MTIRSQIIDALETEFGGASAVVRAPVETLYSDLETLGELTGFSVNETEDVTVTSYGKYRCELPLQVERVEFYENTVDPWRVRAKLRHAQGERILGELIAIVAGIADKTLGGLAIDVSYAGGVAFESSEQHQVVGATIVIRVRYEFDIDDPNSNT